MITDHTSAFGILRLVSKQWNIEVSKALWHTTVFNPASRHRVEDLLGSPFGGMLNNIKKLSVKTANPTKGSNENLLEFLYSIPLDCLTAFDCEDYQANSDAFGLLLRTQPHLSKLVVWLQDESPRGLPSVNLIGNSLQELRSLHFKLLESSDKVLPGINSWLQNAPFVRDLTISAPHLGVLRTWTLPSKAVFPNLRNLTLSGLHLGSPAHDTAVPLYLPRLEALKLCKCQNPGPLLQLTAKQNQASGNDCLRSFAYGNDLSKDVLPAVVDFLRSAKGLTKVVFQVDEAVQMPMLSSLGLHARTIRAFELACGNFGPVCSLQDVEYIVANCTNLERLVLSLGTPVDVDDMKVLDPVQLSTSEEYSRTLVCLHNPYSCHS